jgi:FG-GAP-like repeat/FG-GAP repeat
MRRLIKITLFCLVLNSPLLGSEFLFGDTPQTIIPGDYNGNGASDILWRDSSGNVAMWLMDGLNITGGSAIANISTGWTIVGSGDFNGDGKADILWRDTGGSVAIWLMDGLSITSFSTIANIWIGWTIVGSGDFNGDGKADILWRSISGDVALWFMDGISITKSSTIANIWMGWTIVGTGDFDGDGKADILWSSISGDVAVWLMDAVNITKSRAIANIQPAQFSGKVTSIAVDPSRSATVYAATIGSGTYKTSDGGKTWIASTGLPKDVLTLALDPASPGIVYAGTSIGVFKSVNGGVSWNITGSDLPSAPIRALAIDPRHPTTIYAAPEHGGVFKSLNGGLNWSVAGTGLPATATVQSLAIDPVNSDIIYAGTDVVPPARAEVFRSSDGGEHWESSWLPASANVVAQTIYALVVDPSNPAVIYAGTLNPDREGRFDQAGAFKSSDGGLTWTGMQGLWGPDHRAIRSMAIDPIQTSNVYAASMSGLFWKSTDAGVRSTSPRFGVKNPTLAIDPANPSTIYAGDGLGNGIFKSTNAGVSWQHLDVH